ncbi:MAG: hypothetical protein QOG82_1631 [Actinomycetota bacterium]|nr:hypothetical protein [Actinomycetota bacterium]
MSSDRWRRMLLATLVVATACRAGEGDARLGRAVGPRVDWTNANVHWVTQPQTVAGRFVAYFERNRRLWVGAVDAPTGKVSWEYAASASFLTPGVAIDLAHDDRHVYFAVPAASNVSAPGVVGVVAVDAASGTEIWTTDTSFLLLDSLTTCPGDDTMLCASGATSGGRREIRVAKGTGHVSTPLPDGTTAGTGRSLGAGLHDLGGRDPELIAAIDPSGRTLWTKTASELFQGRLVTSDHGWNWDRHGDILVGSLGWGDSDPSSFDLSQESIAGVDAATGSVVWVDDGAELGCGIVSLSRQESIRCRRTGTATSDPDDPDDVPVVTGLTVVMERFDPATGATLWQADLGAALSLVLDTAPLVRVTPTEFAVGRDDGTSIVVDIVSGHTRPPTLDDVGWCASTNVYVDSLTSGAPENRRGDDYLTQCRPDGSTVFALTASPVETGARLGQTLAWVDAGGMHAGTTGWVRWRARTGGQVTNR